LPQKKERKKQTKIEKKSLGKSSHKENPPPKKNQKKSLKNKDPTPLDFVFKERKFTP
jgi:hypothetical protein